MAAPLFCNPGFRIFQFFQYRRPVGAVCNNGFLRYPVSYTHLRPCDSRAGFKHHLTNDYLSYLKQDVMDLCHREQLHQVDLLSPAEKKITDREYHARRRGQKKMDKLNREMTAGGITPRKTKFETQKDFLRSAIEESAASAHSLEEFQKLLTEKYHISLKVSRGRFSYLHPERGKYITAVSYTHLDVYKRQV